MIAINFDDRSNRDLLDSDKLHEYILHHAKDNEKTYLFLDEIQNVKELLKKEKKTERYKKEAEEIKM